MGDEAHLAEHAPSQRTGLSRRTPGRTSTAAPEEPMRLFVAIAPPAAVLDDLDALAAPLRTGRQDLRWTSREAWHVTLAFLGQVDEVAAARLLPRLERAARRYHAFGLAFSGAGAFPAATRANVLWSGLSGPRGAGSPGRVRGRGREPRGRSPARQGPPVPASPDARALPYARRRHRARRRAGRLPGAAVDRGPYPPGPQPPGRDRAPPLRHPRELAAAPAGSRA